MMILILLLIAVLLTGCGNISDGEYAASVSLTGGSGEAYIESPCRVVIKDEETRADIVWSSPYYDRMIVDGETYYPVDQEGNSEFIIPIELDRDIYVQAETTAMSQPHLIDYQLRFSIIDDEKENISGNKSGDEDARELQSSEGGSGEELLKDPPVIDGIDHLSTDVNGYARCFAIHRYSDGFSLISVDDGRKYLIVPEGAAFIPQTDEGITVLQKPLDRIYLAASGAMCRFDALGETDSVILSGIRQDGWYIDSAREAMENGTMEYGGKYSAPDYEKIIMKDVDLAIENTMILHTPKVMDKLAGAGVPVFIDRSSYEPDPLGRLEWIRVYGLLTDREKEADVIFKEQSELVNVHDGAETSGKTVAVFSINSGHMISTKKNNDYFVKMIEAAGGRYLGPEAAEDGSASSQMKISVESFYEYASGADIIIYNSTIEEAPDSLEELMGTDEVFRDIKAFKNGEVYYTDRSLYQFAGETGTIIDNLRDIFSGEKDDTRFIHKLK